MHGDLTIEQAATLLNVSESFVHDLIERGTLASDRTSSEPMLRSEDVLGYRNTMAWRSREALDELAAEAQRLSLGY